MPVSEIVQAMFKQSASRGKDASGYAWVRGTQSYMLKQPLEPEQFVQQGFVTKEQIPDDIEAIIGHNRHATSGDPKENKNNHPFVSADHKFALVHNGVVRDKYNGSRVLETIVDSEVIMRSVEDELDKGVGMQEAIINQVRMYGGSQTIAVLSNDGLWLSKHGNPLWIAYVPQWDAVVFASTKNILMDSIQPFLTTILGIFPPFALVDAVEDETFEIVRGKPIKKQSIPDSSKWRSFGYAADWQSYKLGATDAVRERPFGLDIASGQTVFRTKVGGGDISYTGTARLPGQTVHPMKYIGDSTGVLFTEKEVDRIYKSAIRIKKVKFETYCDLTGDMRQLADMAGTEFLVKELKTKPFPSTIIYMMEVPMEDDTLILHFFARPDARELKPLLEAADRVEGDTCFAPIPPIDENPYVGENSDCQVVEIDSIDGDEQDPL
jgi:hypothetical protein